MASGQTAIKAYRMIGGCHTLASEKKGEIPGTADAVLFNQSLCTVVRGTVPHNQRMKDPGIPHFAQKVSHSAGVYQALSIEIKKFRRVGKPQELLAVFGNLFCLKKKRCQEWWRDACE